MKKKMMYKLLAGVMAISLAVPTISMLPGMDMEVQAAEGLSVTGVMGISDSGEYHVPDTNTILMFRKNDDGNGVILTRAYDCSGYLTVPSYVDGYPVVQIGYEEANSLGVNAFAAAYELTGIMIPNTVKKIGEYAFNSCTSLTEIVIPDSVISIGEACFYESGIEKITFSSSMKMIPVGACSYCTNLKEVIIPDSITRICAAAFQRCTSLKKINLPNSIQILDEQVFWDCSSLENIVIPNKVTKIAANIFDGCTSLKSITIPASVTSISSYAFGLDNSGATSLKEINYTGSAEQWSKIKVGSGAKTAIKEKATVACADGTKIVKGVATSGGNGNNGSDHNEDPNGGNASSGIQVGYTTTKNKVKYKVTSVTEGKRTVSVTGLSSKTQTSASIPKTVTIKGKSYKVTQIASNAFKNCTKLKKASVGSNVTKIGSNAFYNCKALVSVSGCTKVSAIGNKAFYNCKKLQTIGSAGKAVTLPKVKTIGKSAFYKCTAIRKVNLTSSALASIGDQAFKGCTSMASFTAKSGKLASIGKQAFYGDKKLSSVTLKTTKLKSSKVGSSAFKGIKSTCTFKVPSSKASAYKKILKARGAGSQIRLKKS